MNAPPIDVEAFRETMREMEIEEIVDETLSVFWRELPRIFGRIEEGLHSDDLEAVTLGAHTLKSAAANVWAHPLSEAMATLESASASGDPAATRQAFGPAQERYREVIRFREEGVM